MMRTRWISGSTDALYRVPRVRPRNRAESTRPSCVGSRANPWHPARGDREEGAGPARRATRARSASGAGRGRGAGRTIDPEVVARGMRGGLGSRQESPLRLIARGDGRQASPQLGPMGTGDDRRCRRGGRPARAGGAVAWFRRLVGNERRGDVAGRMHEVEQGGPGEWHPRHGIRRAARGRSRGRAEHDRGEHHKCARPAPDRPR
jgi:hypothetical protein